MNKRLYNISRAVVRIAFLLSIIFSALGSTQPAQATPFFVRDIFSAVAYNNNDGSVSWNGNWTEINDDGTAGGGNVWIGIDPPAPLNGNGIDIGRLRISNRAIVNDLDFEGIQRSVNLASTLSPRLSFTFSSQNLETADVLSVDVYNGSTWTPLGTIKGGDPAGRRTYDISNTNTAIRFVITGGFTNANELIYIDNVEISYQTGGSQTATSILQTVQTYYVPVPEEQALQALLSVSNSSGQPASESPTYVYLALTINSDNTVIYYDHWEDGYDAIINDPQQSTTDVWGDNNPANGAPPGYASDVFSAGSVIVLKNWVDVPIPSSPQIFKFDGRDKFASTQAIAVTRASWSHAAGTQNGGAVEMLDTSVWGVRFDMPADRSTDTSGGLNDFGYAALAIMATRNNTPVYRNGTLKTTLNEGESYLFENINGTNSAAANYILVGDQITTYPGTPNSDYPVQAHVLSGAYQSNYLSSWFTLYPNDKLSSAYYAVVPGFASPARTTRVYLQNPNSSQITVNYQGYLDGSASTIDVGANSAAFVTLATTVGKGVKFWTTGSPVPKFQAISVISSGDTAADWGYTLIPENQITQQAQVGMGVGKDPTDTTVTQNGNPVWLMVADKTSPFTTSQLNVCVDYDGDGVGALTDNNGYRYDQLVPLYHLQQAKIYDSDLDQSGMLLYLCNGSEANRDYNMAVAWGQDPTVASVAVPGIDIGTSIPPLPNFTAIKTAQLTGDLNGDGKFDLGDTFEYQIIINNVGALPIPANLITVKDIVPQYTTYVSNSTRVDGVLVLDNSSPATSFPLDVGGLLINKSLPIEGQIIVTFQVTIDNNLPGSTNIQNQANVSGLDLEYDPQVEIRVDPPTKIGDFIWLDLDGDGAQDAGEPGIPGVTVRLYAVDNTTLLATTTTNSNGQYTFSGLTLNTDYYVRVDPATLPGGLTQTGDPDATLDDQHLVALGTTPYYLADFGYRGNVSIGDFVWYDINRDGVQDGGAEVGLANVTLTLTWAGPDGNLSTTVDNKTFTQVTNSGGGYDFTGLPAGTYSVNLDDTTLPSNYALTTTDPVNTGALTAGTDYNTADFGAAPGATISDFVWNDLDADGVQDAGEGGISGVRVYIDANGNDTYDAGEHYDITDANGLYAITNLAPATYAVRVDTTTLPGGSTQTYDLNGGLDHEASRTVNAGDLATDVDFGYRLGVLSIAKTSDAGDVVLPGDTILYSILVRNNSGGTQTRVSVNDPLPAGTAYVSQSTKFYDPIYYLSQFNGPSYADQPAGSLIWGTNWTEVNENGNSGTGDLRAVTDNTNCPGGGDCARIASSAGTTEYLYRQANLSACTASAPATLSYSYRNALASGTIQVQIYNGSTARTVATYTNANTGNSTASFALQAGELVAGAQVRLAVTASGGASYVYFDNVRLDCVGPQTRDNIPGGTYTDLSNGTPPTLVRYEDNVTLAAGQSLLVTFQATVNNPVSLTSIDNTASVTSAQQPTPQYASVSDTLPPASIGNFVWLDLNANGIQDSGEPGVGGVTVTLYESDGTNLLERDTTTTASDGSYSFGVVPGSYVVGFSLPSGYSFTIPNGGNDALDSDADTTTIPPGKTAVITITAGQVNTTIDAGLRLSAPSGIPTAAIGDRVWLDEDGDGIQDAGESGIPNVTIELRDGSCTPDDDCLTTVTDSEGNYLFAGVTPGTYTVVVISGLPAGLSANPTYDEDGTGTANTSEVTVSAGTEHLTADFGYNWSSTNETNNNTGTGAIGDRVWIDANGDGIQGPGEAGLSGVTVTLVKPGADGIFGTADDDSSTTATPDAAGNYIFDGLPAGAYKVQVTAPGGYTQSGDPDSTIDNQTTTPIILAPGDVYVNADFGYQPTGVTNTIGNQIFVDANGDGNLDAGEPGIPGVTVALRDGSGNVIATTVTDAAGLYSFPGLPDGTYTVWVNDTANVLAGLVQNSTPNNLVDGGQACGSCTGTNMVTVSESGNAFQDFGYAPADHVLYEGMIGNTIFLDRDGGNDYNFGEGLEGVTVQLYFDTNADGNYDAGEPLLYETLTDENGNYYFGNLPPGNYVVKVDTATLPAGVANTVDPDSASPGNVASESGVELVAGEIDLDQDFGYSISTPNTIGGTIWKDANADGKLTDGTGGTPDETNNGVSNVTVVLRDNHGNIVAITTTDTNGNYSFGNLPDGTYTVDVTDDANLLDGYWKSGTPSGQAGNDGYSQSDPYSVTVTGGQTNTTADFGYYVEPADLGDYVWLDRNNNGIQDADEPGIQGVLVTLTITYPATSTTTTISVRTGVGGVYSFGNLLLDEDFDGVGGSSEPTYALSFTIPPGAAASPTSVGDISTDSNGASASASALKGQTDITYDSGFYTVRLDLGDLPNSYLTTFSPGPAHLVFPDANADGKPETANSIPAVWLGNIVDVELNGQPGATATGDDGNTTDDEDGLVLASTGWTAGAGTGVGYPAAPTATITINSDQTGVVIYYGLWIDWDANGSLETFYTSSDTSGSAKDISVPVIVPTDYTANDNVYMRVRASDVLLTSADYQGTLINGEVEDYWFQFDDGGTSTPVTVSYFRAERQGGAVNIEWSTATETGNVGFNLYVEKDGNLVPINNELIPSQAIDSLERLDYTYTANVEGNDFYVEDVSVLGETRRHGPFQVGEVYGDRLDVEKIDWSAIQEQSQTAETARQTRLQPDLGPVAANSTALNLKVRQTGLYRVTYEMLRDAGLDLARIPLTNISLTNQGKPVPIYVIGQKGKFGADAYFEFYGQALDTVYTDTNVYTLQVSRISARRIPVSNTAIARGAKPPLSYTETLVVNNQRSFANYAPGADAWYDTEMLVFTKSKSWDFPFQVNGLADPSAVATLELVVWGATEWPQSPDHHLLVSVNGVALADQTFDGLTEQTLSLVLPAGTLQEGTNILRLTVPGDTGLKWDLINLDKFSVAYQRVFQAVDGKLTFTATGKAFKVTNLPGQNVEVYRFNEKGLARLGKVQVNASGETYTATFAGTGKEATYYVSVVESLYTPAFEASRQTANLNQAAQYLVIAHPNFIAGIQPLVQARRVQGLTVNVVNVTELYAKYTYGVFDPQAIQKYIAYAAQNLGARYVLLVGGDTYDYRNYLGVNSLSFIPSLYARTGPIASFVPADPMYADVNKDNIPDLAIGRFPVRTVNELNLMVNKTLAYAGKNYGRTAVFATDKADGAVSFKSISNDLSTSLPAGWSVENIHLDDVSVSTAQSQLIAAMNRGTSLLTFTGHSGPQTWTFSGLFNINHAKTLTNAGKPFVVVQWGCWNTYYVDPIYTYMVQSFLFSGDRGAAAVLGASTLVDSESEAMLGQFLTPRLVTPGMTLGQALRDAKLELAQTHPELLDVLLGWSLMGDPALVIQP